MILISQATSKGITVLKETLGFSCWPWCPLQSSVSMAFLTRLYSHLNLVSKFFSVLVAQGFAFLHLDLRVWTACHCSCRRVLPSQISQVCRNFQLILPTLGEFISG
jgi:hypothetical protein